MDNAKAKFAQDARNFIALCHHGMLSTLSASQAGYPFGSIAPYDVAANGDIIVYVSLIAEHYKNLKSDPRASLVAVNYFGYDDPQSYSRATLLCKFLEVPEKERSEVQESYESRFPNSIKHEIAHNFTYLRGVPEKIRWIAGFGEMGWVTLDNYRAARPDPIAYDGMGILRHMNEDHGAALVELARAHGKWDPAKYDVRLIDISSANFTLILRGHGEKHLLKIPFPIPLTDNESARDSFIQLIKAARETKK